MALKCVPSPLLSIVSGIQIDTSHARTVLLDVRSDVVNTSTFFSNTHRNLSKRREGTGGQKLTVRDTCTSLSPSNYLHRLDSCQVNDLN